MELTQPVVFAPGISTVNGISFSKMGSTLYTSGSLETQFDNGRAFAGIFESHYGDGQWTELRQVDLGLDVDAYHPVLSVDNATLFFNSRSDPDSFTKSIPHDIWTANRTAEGWANASPLAAANSEAYDSYPSVARSKNLYFSSDREGSSGGMDFYVAYYIDGEYQQPGNLRVLNSSDIENDLVIDPDERFIIFNRHIDSTREIDLFIAFHQDGHWTKPRKLDNINSDDGWELTHHYHLMAPTFFTN